MISIAEAFNEFIRDRQVYCSAATIRTYIGHMQGYFSWLQETYHKSIQELSFGDIPEQDNIITGYILALRQHNPNVRNTSVRSYCRAVKVFLRYCYDCDYCRDYLKGLKLPKDDAAPKEPLYADEVKRLDQCFDMHTVKGLRNYCIVHLMLDCGLRSQEVRHLEVAHLQPAHNLLLIKDSKGSKSRFTLAPDFIFAAIDSYLKLDGRSSGLLFLGLRNREPLTSNAVKQLFGHLKAQSDIPRLHAHLLRHTFATSYLIGGGNLEFLRVFMGHYDYSVTRNYTQIAAQCKMLGVEIYRLDDIFFKRGY